jgi:DNA-binding MarR family transcriptional regulator
VYYKRGGPLAREPAEQEIREAVEAVRGLLAAAERYRQALADHFGLSRIEAQAVGHLAATSGLGQTDLAVRLGVTTSAITALVDRLEASGVARRDRHPTDRRRSIVTLSEQGTNLVEKSRHSVDRLFDGLREQNLAQMTEAVNGLVGNIEREIERL